MKRTRGMSTPLPPKKEQARKRSSRRRCAMASCASVLHSYDTPFCAHHWEMLPEDLRERVKWAGTGESMADYQAALLAAANELSPSRYE